jgi:hypothetical protein
MKTTVLLLTLLAVSCKRPAHTVHHRLAPEGTVYLIEYVSTPTNSGVIGYPPGTRLRLVHDQGDSMTVTTEGRTFNVPGGVVTNDLDLAALAARRDAESQRQIVAMVADQRVAAKADGARQRTLFDQQQAESQARTAQANANHYRSALEGGAYHRDYNVTRGPSLYYRSPYYYRVDSHGNQYWVDQYGGWHY